MQFIFELLLQPFFEVVFHTIGYATAWVVVPIFTLGHVTVGPARQVKRLNPKHGRIQRTGPGRYVMETECAICVGVLFWILLAVGVYVIKRLASG